MPTDPIGQLITKIKATLTAIGIPEDELSGIFAVERGFAIPFAGIQVTLKLLNGERIWEGVERSARMPIDGDREAPKSVILFREGMNQPLLVARKIALHIATIRIDLAIEATA